MSKLRFSILISLLLGAIITSLTLLQKHQQFGLICPNPDMKLISFYQSSRGLPLPYFYQSKCDYPHQTLNGTAAPLGGFKVSNFLIDLILWSVASFLLWASVRTIAVQRRKR